MPHATGRCGEPILRGIISTTISHVRQGKITRAERDALVAAVREMERREDDEKRRRQREAFDRAGREL